MSDDNQEPLVTGKRVSMEISLRDVDPELLALLTGGAIARPQNITIQHTKKRTFWQWLRRKPKVTRTLYLPNARIEPTQLGETQ